MRNESDSETDELYQKKVEEQLKELEMDDEERIQKEREERRKRFEMLKRKSEQQQQQNQTNGETNRDINEQKIELTNVKKDEETNGKKDEEMNGKKDEETNGHQKSSELQTNEQQPKKESTKPDEEGKSSTEIFDMFSDSPIPTTNISQDTTKQYSDNVQNLSANWDDKDGYLVYQIGELFNGQYRVVGSFGRGVYSQVAKAQDTKSNDKIVAIKILRNNEVMRKAGMKEVEYLKRLAAADPENKCYIVRMLDSFFYKNHLCIVFEPEHLNLREVLKIYGKEEGRQVGINIDAVRLYAKQMFIALKHLKNLKLLHSDIKPDNIMVNEKKNAIKLCDFGSVTEISDVVITPLLQSRFYRAPEIALGLEYDYAIDMWSVACTIYELYTGKVLFPSRDNNEMLRMMMELKGRIPDKLIKKGKFSREHFDEEGYFLNHDIDPVTQKPIVSKMNVQKKRDLKQELLDANLDNSKESKKKVLLLYELLDKALNLDPARRLTVKQALQHPFVTGV